MVNRVVVPVQIQVHSAGAVAFWAVASPPFGVRIGHRAVAAPAANQQSGGLPAAPTLTRSSLRSGNPPLAAVRSLSRPLRWRTTRVILSHGAD